jgi:hypothetical protein
MSSSILNRLRDRIAYGQADSAFIEEMRAALADGVITDDERHWILERHAELGAGDAWRQVAGSLFLAAIRGAAKNGELTEEAAAELLRIESYLELTPNQAEPGHRRIIEALQARKNRIAQEDHERQMWEHRQAILRALRSGDPIEINVRNVIFASSERPLWEAHGILYEEYQGKRKINGVVIRELVRDEISRGRLVITTQRILFCGDIESKSTPLAKVVNLAFLSDGLRWHQQNRSKGNLVILNDARDGELIQAALHRAVEQ